MTATRIDGIPGKMIEASSGRSSESAFIEFPGPAGHPEHQRTCAAFGAPRTATEDRFGTRLAYLAGFVNDSMKALNWTARACSPARRVHSGLNVPAESSGRFDDWHWPNG
jgi:hypothetical protein